MGQFLRRPELLDVSDSILKELDPRSLCNLRLVCKIVKEIVDSRQNQWIRKVINVIRKRLKNLEAVLIGKEWSQDIIDAITKSQDFDAILKLAVILKDFEHFCIKYEAEYQWSLTFSSLLDFVIKHDQDLDNFMTLYGFMSNKESLDPLGNSILHVLASNGRLDILSLIIEDFSDKSPRNIMSETPLHLAVAFNKLDTFKFLLTHSKKKNPESHSGLTLLHSVAMKGNKAMLESLVPFCKDLDPLNAKGETPLFSAIIFGRKTMVEMLLPMTLKLEHLNVHGNNLLHVAAEAGNLDILKLVFPFVRGNRAKNSYNLTPFDIAVKNGRFEIVKFFLQRTKYPISISMLSTVLKASFHSRLFKLLYCHADENIQELAFYPRAGEPNLFLLAAMYRQKDCVEFLIDEHAKIFGTTRNHVELITSLLGF